MSRTLLRSLHLVSQFRGPGTGHWLDGQCTITGIDGKFLLNFYKLPKDDVLSPALLHQALDVTISPIMRLYPITIGDGLGYLYTQACAYYVQ